MTIDARENTHIKITFPKTDMTNSDRHHPLPQISALEEVVRQKQREIEDKKNVLQACQNVEKQSDSVEKITLIEQICK